MPLIEPSTVIYFCSDVPLNNLYTDTLYFTTAEQQRAYFGNKIAFTMRNCTYQRENRSIRVSSAISAIDKCNYLYWINPAFENRWYYAFVTGYNYVNNEITEVTFEIDVIQTYFLDCSLRQCFVERGHTSDDTIGKNRVPENLETGEYKSINFTHTTALDKLVICVASTAYSDGENVSGSIYAGVYSGVRIFAFDTAAEVNSFLKGLTDQNKADAVVNIFMMPHTFTVNENGAIKFNDFNIAKPYTTIDGYAPRNKKLFLYPYNVLHISNGEGVSADFRYEEFTSDPCHFEVIGSMCSTPQAICVPTLYKGVQGRNFEEKLVLDGWSQCAWNIDTYKAWLAQNANLIDWQDNTSLMLQRHVQTRNTQTSVGAVINTIGSAIGAGTQIGMAMASHGATLQSNPQGFASSMLGLGSSLSNAYFQDKSNQINIENVQNQIDQILAMREDHATTPPQAIGGGSSTVMQGLGLKSFFINQKQITAEFAKIIDDYFTLYGYAQHKLAHPNIHARQRYSYVKTKGCVVTGNAPVWAVSAIARIMDTGITWWADTTNVGNYTADNPTIAGGEY